MNLFSISKIARSLAIFTLALFVLGSCEKKENTIGSGFLDGEKFGSGIYRKTKITAFTTERDSIVTSRAKVNLLGVYKDPIFGQIKTSFGLQIGLSEEGPDFGANALVDSVILTMPYLGRVESDKINYETDSIYGDVTIPMDIIISEMGDYLNPSDTYYSFFDLTKNIVTEIDRFDSFIPELDSITLYGHERDGKVKDTTTIPASFRVKLDTAYFQRKIINLNKNGIKDYKLAEESNFFNYINGLVFDIQGTNGAVITFDMFKNSSLIIYYKNDDTDDKGEPTPPQNFDLKFSNSYASINSYKFDRSSADASLITQIDPNYQQDQGSDYLFLQGMSGLEAEIELFTDRVQLDTLRKENWMINRAELVYRVSDDNGKAVAPPFRLMMANSDSLEVAGADYRIIDYVIEPAAFDGYLRSDVTILSDNVEKRYYKFRLTNHISAILDGEIKMNENGEYEVVYDDKVNYKIKLTSFSGSTSVSRTKMHGTNNIDKSKNLFLEIHYSKKDL